MRAASRGTELLRCRARRCCVSRSMDGARAARASRAGGTPRTAAKAPLCQSATPSAVAAFPYGRRKIQVPTRCQSMSLVHLREEGPADSDLLGFQSIRLRDLEGIYVRLKQLQSFITVQQTTPSPLNLAYMSNTLEQYRTVQDRGKEVPAFCTTGLSYDLL